MIYVGIDDTDTLDTRGTNQLARALAARLHDRLTCLRITRHQLLDDPRVPYTSKNGSASLVFNRRGEVDLERLASELAQAMRDDFIPGSDPGLCVADSAPKAVCEFGLRCQRELVTQDHARRLAAAERISLVGLGGTEDGVIGALAAIGLAAGENDGRVIQLAGWPDDACGILTLGDLHERRVTIQEYETRRPIQRGRVDVGKKLRPNWRNGRCVLFVRLVGKLESQDEGDPLYEAVKLP